MTFSLALKQTRNTGLIRTSAGWVPYAIIRLLSSLVDSVQDSVPLPPAPKAPGSLSVAVDISSQGRSVFLQPEKQVEHVGRLPMQDLLHCPETREALNSMAMS